MQALLEYLSFLRLDWKDLAEILIVAFLVYRILLVYTGTRAFQVLVGLVLLVTVYVAAGALELRLIPYLLSQIFTYGAFALIVIFQPELRAALARLGRSRLFQLFARLERHEVLEEVVRAADRLARAKVGGIIAIEQEVNLLDHVDHGTPIDAALTSELLTTIFTPYSPLHDGAVIVKGDRIAYAGSVILRLSESPAVDRSLGTRHRAALGLSEETDSHVVVISEETGQISLARGGRLFRGLKPDELRQRLESPGGEATPEAGQAAPRDGARTSALAAGGGGSD